MRSSNIQSLIKVFALLRREQKRALIGVFVLMVVTAFLELLNVSLFVPLIHVALNPTQAISLPLIGEVGLETALGGTVSPFVAIAVLLFAVFVIKNAFIGVAVYLQAQFVARIRAYMLTRLVEGYANMPYEQHLQINSAKAVYDISQTAPAVVAGIIQPSLGMALEVLLVSGAAAALFLVDPYAALFVGGIVGVALAALYYAIRGWTYSLSEHGLHLNRDVNRWAHFLLGATKESIVLRRMHYFLDRVRTITYDRVRIDTLSTLIGQLPRLYGELVVVGVLLFAVAFLIERHGSANSVLPVLAVFAAAALRVFPSINRIALYATTLRRTAPLLDSIYPDIRQATLHGHGSEDLATSSPVNPSHRFVRDIRLDGVSYRYPGAAEATLRDLNLTIRCGEAVAFVGATGAGKSTLADIILGLLPPSTGLVLFDGRPVEAGDDSWRGRIGYVPQSIYLVDDTIRRNIALGVEDPDIDTTRIQDVIRIARLEEFTSGLRDGLDTIVGERGVRLSGGQRQRIGIARALYTDPDLLVLDEATASLDSGTERDIAEAIDMLLGKKTLIIIAHRLATVRKCDRLFFLEQGRILAEGDFHQLQADCPPFRLLVDLAGENPARDMETLADAPSLVGDRS